jgi:hypothetical protein
MQPDVFIDIFQERDPASYKMSQLTYSPFEEWNENNHCFAAAAIWLSNFMDIPFSDLIAGVSLCNPSDNPQQKGMIEQTQSRARFYDWESPYYDKDVNDQLAPLSLKVEKKSQQIYSNLNDAIKSISSEGSGLIFMQISKGLSSKNIPGHTLAFACRTCEETKQTVFGIFETGIGQILLRMDHDEVINTFKWDQNHYQDTMMLDCVSEKIDINYQITCLIGKINNEMRKDYKVFRGLGLSYHPQPVTKTFLNQYSTFRNGEERNHVEIPSQDHKHLFSPHHFLG